MPRLDDKMLEKPFFDPCAAHNQPTTGDDDLALEQAMDDVLWDWQRGKVALEDVGKLLQAKVESRLEAINEQNARRNVG